MARQKHCGLRKPPSPHSERCVAPLDRHFTVAPDSFSENNGYPRSKARAQPRHRMATQIGRRSALPELIGHRTGPSAMEVSRSAAATPSAQRREQRPHATTSPRQSWWKGAATRALCSLYALDVEVSQRASRHACTHDSLMHHMLASASWRALAGQGKMASCWSISSFGLECRVAGCLLWAVF